MVMLVNCSPSMLPSSLSATAMPLQTRLPSTWTCHLLRGLHGDFHKLQLIRTFYVALTAHSMCYSRERIPYLHCDNQPPGKPSLTAEGLLAVCRAPVALHDGDVLEGQGAEHRFALVADLDGGGARLQDAAVHQQQLHPAAGCRHVQGQSGRIKPGQV